MSPVAGKGQTNLRTTLLVAVAGVVAAVALLFVVTRLSGSGEVELQIGDERFNAGKVTRISAEIDDRGPILYSDVGGGKRDIWLMHLGDDPEEGWLAFDARQPDASRDCTLVWEVDAEQFVDPCDGTIVAPDGGDLPSYPTEVEDGDVLVDLAG